MKTTKQMIDVMQAYVDGRGIEYQFNKENDSWGEITDPAWAWDTIDYRIKKRKLYAIYDNNNNWRGTKSSVAAAELELKIINDGYYIEFEEVIND